MLDKIAVTDWLNNEINPITQFGHFWCSIRHFHHNILIIGLSYANIYEKIFTLLFFIIQIEHF